jgi:hypothetical protein
VGSQRSHQAIEHFPDVLDLLRKRAELVRAKQPQFMRDDQVRLQLNGRAPSHGKKLDVLPS